MAETFSQAIQRVIQQANQVFTQVQVLRHDIDQQRALINLTGQWGNYRIVIQEIYRLVTIRYSYYVLYCISFETYTLIMTMRSPQSFADSPQIIADSCPKKYHFDLKRSIDSNNQMVHGFDNSPDRVEIQLYYGRNGKIINMQKSPINMTVIAK